MSAISRSPPPASSSSPSWRDEYIAALQERDIREKANADFIDAYTRLADRTAALEAEKAAAQSASSSTATVTPRDKAASNTNLTAAAATVANASTGADKPSEEVAQLRSDLAEAIRSKGQLQARLKAAEAELQKISAKNKIDSKAVKDLTTERAILITKVRDRDEELRGKAKLLEQVQDEMISLNLQLNMAEDRSKKLQKENKELIDRWMARMGQEADAMNNAYKFS